MIIVVSLALSVGIGDPKGDEFNIVVNVHVGLKIDVLVELLKLDFMELVTTWKHKFVFESTIEIMTCDSNIFKFTFISFFYIHIIGWYPT